MNNWVNAGSVPYIGNRNGLDGYFNGEIDQVRIYSTALTSSQVTQLYNEKPEVDTSNFKAVVYEGNGGTQYISNVGMDLETNGGLVWIKSRTLAASHGLYDFVRGSGYWLRSDHTDAQQFQRSTGYLSSFDSNGFTLSEGSSTDPTYTASYETHQINQDYAAWCWKGGGLLNKSASFNGSSSYIDTSLSVASNAGSVSLWVKTTDTTASFFGTNSNSDTNRFYFGVRDSKFWIGAGNTQSYTVSASNLIDGNWHNVVLALDGSTAKYYLDGASTPVASTSYSGGGVCDLNPVIGSLRASGGISSAYYANGDIDQVRVFNKAISASEVTTLYNETASTINTLQVLGDTSCVATYPLGVGAGDLSNTYSGTPSNVTFNNPGHLTRNNSGTIESTVSANTEAGFSIVKYSGNTGADQTVGTGLTTPCDIVIVKRLTDSGYSWCVGGSVVGNGNNLYLDSSGELLVRDRIKSVQSETFTVEQVHEVNNTGKDYIAYCFHSVAGYSKIGSYTGNSSTTGPIVYTTDDGTSGGSNGFKPRFIMVKGVTANYSSHWMMMDSARDTDTVKDKRLLANLSNVETDDSNWAVEFLDNGFQPKSTFSGFNNSAGTYIYMAFK
jgi:hypothetical protein